MYSGRTFQDMKNWDKQIGKVYFEKHPSDPKQYRTIRIGWNPFANTKIPQTSNWITGVPPDNLEPASPILLSNLRRVPQHMPY